MATWTSLVVLSLAVVSTLSFPRPKEYKIPTVGQGPRAQYYVLHSDGGFKYGYDTGDGAFEQSMAQIPGEVSGAFGYKDPTGADIKLEYTADERGFIPRGGHLPVFPEGDFGAKVRSSAQSLAATRTSGTFPAKPVEVSQIRSILNADGSYNFGYDTSSSSRSETADAQNSVQGKFSFTADDGTSRAIKYTAGSGTGYIVEGDGLPVGPSVPGAENGIPTGRILPVISEEQANAFATSNAVDIRSQSPSFQATRAAVGANLAPTGPADASYSFNYDAGDSSRSETADANLNIKGSYSFLPPQGHKLTVNYVAGSDTGFVATGDHLPSTKQFAPTSVSRAAAAATRTQAHATFRASDPATPVEVAQVRSSLNDDNSYRFSYETSSSSRDESADSQNSVQGRYSFVADDGINREIKYSANSATGYIAEGDSLPIGPSVPGAESGIPTGRILPILSEAEANALAAETSGSNFASAYSATGSVSSAISGSPTSSDSSYSFKYDAGDSNREESADANLNIKGSYSFVPPEGHRLTVNYVAGSDTGFVATGAHLPEAGEPGAVPYSAAPTGISSADSASFTAPSSNVAPSITYSAADSSDPSYSFSYNAGDSDREESADANLNIKGSYSFVPPEGHRLTVNYVAGSDTGFVATGAHLPEAGEVGAVPYSAAPTGISSAGSASLAAPSSNVAPSITYNAADSSDSSYSFSYNAGDSDRAETADANLNVQGKYSFVPPDGHRLTVNYIAGSDTGFVATGDHLPKTTDSVNAQGAAGYSAFASGSAPVSVGSANVASAYDTKTRGVAQVRSSSDSDGSYRFSYENSDSSRSESADAQNSVTGEYAFVADDGVNRKITYIAGRETGYIAEGDSLPIGPPVPGAENGIPTGRILPVLSEDEANALARSSSNVGPSPLLKTSAAGGATATSADASYSFSFDSDSYSRNEEADADGNIVGSYTYVDEDGKEHTVNFVAGRETGFLPEGFPIPSPASAPVASPSAGRTTFKATGATAAKPAESTATTYKSEPKRTDGHSSRLIGDVLLHQYDSVNRDKYGYVFTAVRR